MNLRTLLWYKKAKIQNQKSNNRTRMNSWVRPGVAEWLVSHSNPMCNWLWMRKTSRVCLKGQESYSHIFYLSVWSVYTIKHVLGDHPREHWNMVTNDRWSLNTGLIYIKYTKKGNKI